MLIPDVNVILNVSMASLPFHDSAVRWFDEAVRRDETVGIPDFILAAVIRIGTNPRAFPLPLAMDEALAVCDSWRGMRQYRVLDGGSRHWQTFREVVSTSGVTGPSVTDAYIASFAIHHNATLVTFDRGFSRFPGLRWFHPGP